MTLSYVRTWLLPQRTRDAIRRDGRIAESTARRINSTNQKQHLNQVVSEIREAGF